MSTPRPAVLPNWLYVGFSGHRHLSDTAGVDVALRTVLDGLERRTPRLVGVSSAALGADTLFAEEMQRRRHPIRLVLPFPVTRFEQDFAGTPGAWTRARKVIDAAIDVDVVGAFDLEQESPEDAYLEAGVRTVDESGLLIAVWDQQPVKGKGGTADVVAYARSIGRPVILIDPATGAVTEQGLDRLRAFGDANEPIDDSESPRAIVEAYYAGVNHEAEQYAPVVRELMRWCVLLQLGASSMTTAGLVFEAEGPAAIVVAAVDATVLVLSFVLLWMRGRRHREWRRLRAEAEVCRSALATWDIRRVGRTPARAPLPGLGDLSRTLELLRQIDRTAARPLPEVRAHYEAGRIQNQINYFTSRLDVARGQVKQRKILITLFTVVGVAAAVMSGTVTVTGTEAPIARHWLEFLAIVAPLGASALGVLLITDESARRRERYAEMVASLRAWLPRLRECRTWESLGRIAGLVEDQLLQEVLEWRSFAKYTEHVE